MFGDFSCFDQEIREQVKRCHQEYETARRNINKQPGYTVDWVLVDKAWKTAVQRHCGNENRGQWYRKSRDLYITHPKAVMEELSRLHCKSSVLAAALLHDTMEDCAMTYEVLREGFSYEVAQIVSAVTLIKAEEKDAEPRLESMTDLEKREFLEKITDAKLVPYQFQREAFLIRFADRAHNLQTIASFTNDKRLRKIASTRAFLIPAARKFGMRYFEVILNEWCMRFDGVHFERNKCAAILEKRNALTKLSSSAYSLFDQILQDAIAEQTVFSFPAFNPYAKLRGFSNESGSDEMRATGRRVMLAYEIKQQLDLGKSFERGQLDLWEIILTCQDRDIHDMLANFIAIYRAHLRDKGIYFEHVGKDGDCLCIRLRDNVENNYRVVLVPETKLEAYFIGDRQDGRLTMVHETAPSDALRPQITVYSYSPRKKKFRKHEKCVPYGATALDFAFIVHKELGVTVKSAWIHKWKGADTPPFREEDYKYPLSTILSEDDVVCFDADYERAGEIVIYSKSNVDFDSLLDVNTQYGKSCLIEHFKKEYTNNK